MSTVIRRARSVVERRLVRNTGWSMVGELGRLFTQITVFVILTYLYEPDEYGVLVGALGLLWFIQPYSQLGATHLLLQRVAGDREDLEEATALGLSTVVVGGVAATVVLLALQPFVLPQVDPLTLGLLSVSELIAMAMIEVVAFVAVATERIRAMALLRTAHGVARAVVALILFAVATEPELWMWALAATLAALVTALIGLFLLNGSIPKPVVPGRGDLREGVPLSVGFGAEKIRSSADAFLLVRLDREFDAGIYGAATRLVNIARIPITALLHASNARLYAAGASSVREARDLAARLTTGAFWLSGATALVLFVGVDVIIDLLPAEYADTAEAVRWLTFLPLSSSLSVFAGTALTAIRRHGTRVALISTAAAVNIALNIAWIPDHGWKGAAVASFISSGMYAVSTWFMLLRYAAAEAHRTDRT